MEISITARGGGKTTRALEWLMKTPNSVLVTFSTDEAKRLCEHMVKLVSEKERIKKQDYDILFALWRERIMTWREYSSGKTLGTGKEVVGIDNADYILQSMCREKLDFVSMSSDDK